MKCLLVNDKVHLEMRKCKNPQNSHPLAAWPGHHPKYFFLGFIFKIPPAGWLAGWWLLAGALEVHIQPWNLTFSPGG